MKVKQVSRQALLAAIAVLLCHHSLAPAAATQSKVPNIIVILADDLGYSDLGCYGGEINTPNLDGLAKNGLRFTQFYNSARCCPTRAALLTGLYPHEAGVGMMTSDAGAQYPGYRGAIQPYAVTLAEVLRTAGYRTAMSGKWHVGDKLSPIERGFDDFYGFTRGYAVDSFDARMMVRLPEGKPQRSYKAGDYFATDAITDHALDFVSDARQTKQPWFLYIAYQAPHFPVQSRADDAAPYAKTYDRGWDKLREERLARMKRAGSVAKGTPLTARSPIHRPDVAKRLGSMTADGNNPAWDSLDAERRADLAGRMKAYAGMVSGMDRNIGRLIADLKRNGELDNTLILFLSDNGACAEWEPFGFDLTRPANVTAGFGINIGTPNSPNILHRGAELGAVGGADSLISYGSAWANLSNTPWRLYKHYSHEGGISSPLIAHWPARIKARGQWRAQPGHIIDVMATLVDVAGATYPKERAGVATAPMEGVSLRPAFANKPLARKAPLFFEHDGSRAVREGKWKLVSTRTGEWELYDIEADRTELNNLAAGNPDKVKTLAARWDEWAKRTNVLPRPGGASASPRAGVREDTLPGKGLPAKPARGDAGAPRPNVVFVLIDDLGYGDFSCTGNKDVRTENIDRLAAEGIRFTQFYVSSPICSPSRTAFLTGQYPARHHMHSYLNNRAENKRRGMPDWLDPNALSLARTLKQAGYATAHAGKWHLGGGRDVGDAPLPQAYGFDESLTSFEGLGDRLLIKDDGLSNQNAKLGNGNIMWLEKHELTREYVNRSIDFVTRNKSSPFYLQLWLCDVHDGHKPSAESLAKFAGKGRGEDDRKFFAVLDEMDKELGRLFAALDKLGLAENTLIVLTGDNGPTAWPSYYKRGVEPPGSTAGLRGRKWSLYEGGIKQPLIVRWKGRIPAGRVNETSVITAVDLFPTLGKLTGAALPKVEFDGAEMSRALLGKAQTRPHPIFWEYGRDENYLKPGRESDQSQVLALRDGRWKFLVNPDGSKPELYDLQRDPQEANNLLAAQPKRADAMKRRLLAWRRSLPDAPTMLTDKPERTPSK